LEKKIILVVEDELNIRRIIKITLEMEGFTVIEAQNGVEALEMAEKHRPHLIITDIMMPEMDGIQFYMSLKEMPEAVDTPVIVLTAKSQSEDVKYATLLGVDEYLSKPFNPPDLVDRVKGMLMR
jgi:two-component system KDP operon response regulator KdpE